MQSEKEGEAKLTNSPLKYNRGKGKGPEEPTGTNKGKYILPRGKGETNEEGLLELKRIETTWDTYG